MVRCVGAASETARQTENGRAVLAQPLADTARRERRFGRHPARIRGSLWDMLTG
jgi:hypothetical protein